MGPGVPPGEGSQRAGAWSGFSSLMAAVQQGAPLLPSLHFVDWAEHGGVELLPAWRCRQSRMQSPTGQHTERFWDPKVLYRARGCPGRVDNNLYLLLPRVGPSSAQGRGSSDPLESASKNR